MESEGTGLGFSACVSVCQQGHPVGDIEQHNLSSEGCLCVCVWGGGSVLLLHHMLGLEGELGTTFACVVLGRGRGRGWAVGTPSTLSWVMRLHSVPVLLKHSKATTVCRLCIQHTHEHPFCLLFTLLSLLLLLLLPLLHRRCGRPP
jgi:hypothetical protein